ncbi:MAG: multidrug efflux protein [Rhodospirillaceae bacterium]|nr:multidrug efflux protein [Rhodospirillaceae bacterium]
MKTVFTDLFIRRPVLAVVLSLLIFFVGLRSLTGLELRQFPRYDAAQISVSTGYPGASPALMQGFITTPMEQAISSAEGIDYMTASSSQGRSNVTAYLKLNYDPNKALTEIMSKVQQVKNLIPRGSNDPVIFKQNTAGNPVMFIAFWSDDMSITQVSDFVVRVVQPLLATVEGVASSDLQGGQNFAMRLWLDADRMAARGITGQDVAAALQANNVQSAPGQAKGLFTVTNITTNTGLVDVDQFKTLIVKQVGGTVVRMSDIAKVELDAQNASSNMSVDGKPGIQVLVQPSPSGNPLTISDGVKEKLELLKPALPPGLHMRLNFDSSVFVRTSITEVVKTLIEATLVVMLVIYVSLGTFRAVMIPVIAIPLSLVGAGTLMLAAGFSINLLTLLSMVLAVGLVVDDAIVVVENVHRHVHEGHNPLAAALIGARELVGPVIAMTITLAAVYAPIGFLTGITGTLFKEFAFSLAGAVVISGLVALTLSPMLTSMLLTRNMDESGFARIVEQYYTRITAAYSRRLSTVLDYRPAALLFAAVIFGSVYFLYTGSKSELAPVEDQGFSFVPFKGPQYANLDYTTAYGRQGAEILKQNVPEMTRFVNINGMNGVNSGMLLMGYSDWNDRKRTTEEISQAVAGPLSKLTGVRATPQLPPLLPGTFGPPIQMVVAGIADYETIFKVMDNLKTEARKSGLFLYTDSDLDFNQPEIRLKVDAAKANTLGVNMQAVAGTLAGLVGENYVNLFSMSGKSYQVIPQVAREQRLNAQSLTQFNVTAANGQQVPLSAFVTLDFGATPNLRSEYNQLNAATFSAAPAQGVTLGEGVMYLEQLASRLPAGFVHDYLSESRKFMQEGNALVGTFVFALIIIYLVLAAQFESLRDPLVVLVSVPMSICGALIPLYFGPLLHNVFHVNGATINIYTQVGLVTLIGLISKHGILMVTFANDLQRREGLDRRSAIERAARVRLRPILMTTAAMVLGVLPLVFASGPGAASRFSIGLVIASGMSVGTLFTLFVLPVVYTLIAQDHRAEATSARQTELAPAE